MGRYSPPPPHRCAITENNRIEEAGRAKKLRKLQEEMGFSVTQAEGLLEMGIEPEVSVKTVSTKFFSDLPDGLRNTLSTVHPEEEENLPDTRKATLNAPCVECGTGQYHRKGCPRGCPGCLFDGTNIRHTPESGRR